MNTRKLSLVTAVTVDLILMPTVVKINNFDKVA